MEEKKCFKCGEVKGLSSFYKHPGMADGRVNKCKECNRRDVRENRKNKIDYYRAYDRDRGNRQPHDYMKEYRSKYPNKYKAHSCVHNAITSGKLFKEPCCACGSDENLHAHHDDYLKPLNVRWMCVICHRRWHEENGPGNNDL